MPNSITPTGIQIQTQTQIINELINGKDGRPGLKQIYGNDINVASDSPDGQLVNLVALAKKDALDLFAQNYTSKDPEQAVGTALDFAAAYMGIKRKGGTYTRVSVSVTTDREITLPGMDSTTQTPFTVADSVGNRFRLISTEALSAGTTAVNFEAEEIGYIQVMPNDVTTIVTVTLGVVSVNNPAIPYVVGLDQETDAQFRLRLLASASKPSRGFLTSLSAALNNISGVSAAKVWENNTNTTDADGTPAHTIWCVVDGGTNEEIAEAVYTYRSLGAGMRGAVEVNITEVTGNIIMVKFDRVVLQDLYVRFGVESISGGEIDTDGLVAELAQKYILDINEPADITTVSSLVKRINPDVIISACQVSRDDTNWYDKILPTDKQHRFILSAENIEILT